jgi:hypothetical protein
MRVNPSTNLVFTVNGTWVKHFKSFPYLGCLLLIDGGALENIHTHIKKVNLAFVKLYPVWNNKNILLRTKIQLFNKYVKFFILYGRGTWKITKQVGNSLPVFVN